MIREELNRLAEAESHNNHLDVIIERISRDHAFPSISGNVSRVLAMTNDENEDLRRLTEEIVVPDLFITC